MQILGVAPTVATFSIATLFIAWRLPPPGPKARALTTGQTACVLAWLFAVCSWAASFLLSRTPPKVGGPQVVPLTRVVTRTEDVDDISAGDDVRAVDEDTESLRFLSKSLVHTCLFGCVLMFFVYTSSVDVMAGTKVFNVDTFVSLHLLLFLASLLTIRQSKTDHVLNRDQTEEWKGWMQIIFLAYHYYHAGTAVYNLVRVLIGAYVWMTGFGHCCYFLTKANYDAVRVVRTLLRLNFLVVFTCFSTGNEYMLYYICSMHTFWFFVVYLTMYIGRQHNQLASVMVTKLVVLFVFITAAYEVPGLFKLLVWPLKPLLEWRHDGLHEFDFRTGLDRYAAWLGMVCAFLLPRFTAWLQHLEKQDIKHQLVVKGGITAVLLAATTWWALNIYVKPKFEYNKFHPYWEWIPILTWMWCRNALPVLRRHYLHMFAFWGRVTLESYICQLHILLTRNAKAVLVLFPGYPMVTVIICSLFFGVCSIVLFQGTVFFTDLIAPHGRPHETVKRLALTTTAIGLFYILSGVLRSFV